MNRASLRLYPDVLDVAEVMKILRIGRVSVYKLIGSKKLPARKIAGKYRIPKSGLITLFEMMEQSDMKLRTFQSRR
jgi:excisionase family DNA binding protein